MSNASVAAKNRATVRGSELLANRKVAAEIAKAGERIGRDLDIKARDVVAELAKIGFINPGFPR